MHSSWCVSHASSPRENELHNDTCRTNYNIADTEYSYPEKYEKLPILSRNNFCGSKFTHTSQSVQAYKAKTKRTINMMKIHKIYICHQLIFPLILLWKIIKVALFTIWKLFIKFLAQ